MTVCCIYIAQTTATATPFTRNQSIDDMTVTSNAVKNSNPTYTDCMKLRIDGYYFPNNVSCLSKNFIPLGFLEILSPSDWIIYSQCIDLL